MTAVLHTAHNSRSITHCLIAGTVARTVVRTAAGTAIAYRARQATRQRFAFFFTCYYCRREYIRFHFVLSVDLLPAPPPLPDRCTCLTSLNTTFSRLIFCLTPIRHENRTSDACLREEYTSARKRDVSRPRAQPPTRTCCQPAAQLSIATCCIAIVRPPARL